MQKMAVLGCLGVIVLLGIILVAVGAGGYNGLNTKSNDVDGKWANVQTQYQRRADLIPNLVNTVKGSADFEKSTLDARHQGPRQRHPGQDRPQPRPDRSRPTRSLPEGAGQLSGSLSRLLVSVEKYPDLQSTKAFRDLSAEISGTENRIAVARHDFNTSTQSYNTARSAFPAVLYADLFGFQAKPFFKADEASQTAPKVDFGLFQRHASTRRHGALRAGCQEARRLTHHVPSVVSGHEYDASPPTMAAAIAARPACFLPRRASGRGHSAQAHTVFQRQRADGAARDGRPN